MHETQADETSRDEISAPARDCVEIEVLRSSDLLAGRQEVFIEHAGQIYRLRVTRSGKLILQK